MKPITEDQVICLMRGLEAREKKALKRLVNSVEHQDIGGRMTARVLDFSRAETESRPMQTNKTVPVALDEARSARKAHRAVHGFFLYALAEEDSPA